jgi:hypothetical protein
MLTPIAYTVHCEIDDPELAEDWLAWLEDAHLKDVLDAGATEATVVRLDGEPASFEVRYAFPSRKAFDTYERDHAPRLRAEGLARFPLSRGLRYRRTTGGIVARQSSAERTSSSD